MVVNREALAWAGGFYSGEGSTHTHTNAKGRHRKYVRTIITNTSLEALERFYKAVDGIGHLSRMQEHKKNPNCKPFYHWRAASFEEAQAVIALMWSFLSREKKDQAKKALLTSLADHSLKRPITRNEKGQFAADCSWF